MDKYMGERASNLSPHIFIAVGIFDKSFPIRTALLKLVSRYCLFHLVNIQPSEEPPGKHFSARFPVLPVLGAVVSRSWL